MMDPMDDLREDLAYFESRVGQLEAQVGRLQSAVRRLNDVVDLVMEVRDEVGKSRLDIESLIPDLRPGDLYPLERDDASQ